MSKDSSPNSATPAVPNPQDHLVSLTHSYLRSVRNYLLSSLVPVNLALKLADRVGGPTAENGVFKQFLQEVQNGLVTKMGSSSDFISKIMPRYLTEILRYTMYTGEILEFGEQNLFDLTQAYESDLDDATRQLYKQRVFHRFMDKLGPHGLKFIQTMQAKEADGWIAKVITTAQSNLPAPSVEEFELMLRDAFRKQGSLEYAEHFSDFFVVKEILGAGTVGIAALMQEKKSKDELVVKILRKGSREEFQKDFECLTIAAEDLLARGEITAQQAQSFKDYNQEMFDREMQELNPNLEMCFLSESPYQQKGVCQTVKGNLELAGKAENVVFMEKAEGVELGKYLQSLCHDLANVASEEEKKTYLAKIATLRHVYSRLAMLHFQRQFSNQSVHSDLHPGNLFYDEKTNMLWIFDLGSMVHPLEPKEHLRLHRFLFALNLSLGSADVQFLRHYYQNEIKENPKLKFEHIGPMLEKLQDKLDHIRIEHANKNVIDIDVAAAQVMGIIKDSILAEGLHIVPSALFVMAKANAPVNDALDMLRFILSSSMYGDAIPYSERTQLAIALKASFQVRSLQKTLWTKEIFEYFSQIILHPRAGFSQLQFEKKFIYGALGLNEKEAAFADILIPATVITAPFALYLAGTYIKKLAQTVSVKLPQIIDSYQVMQKLIKNSEAGMKHFTQFAQRYGEYGHFKNWFSKNSPVEKSPAPASTTKPKPQWLGKKTVTPTLFLQRLKGHRALRFFIPGVIIGGLAAETYHRWRNPDETPAQKNYFGKGPK